MTSLRRSVAAAVVSFLALSAQAQMVIPCESINGTYRECRIGMSGKIRLVSELSDSRCFEGTSWGTADQGVVWVNRGCRARFAIQASGFDKVVCESLDGQRQDCHADTSLGVDLVQQLSREACVADHTWGFDRDHDLMWVDRGCRGIFLMGKRIGPIQPQETLDGIVRCESMDGRKTQCPAATAAGVQIIRQLSADRCRFRQEWGYDAAGVWVTHGCRAEFAAHSANKPLASTIVCESNNGARKDCPADGHYGVALVRQTSQNKCVLDESWGFDNETVWVTNGCGGQFALGGFRLPADRVPPTAEKIVCQSIDGKFTRCATNAARGAGLVRQISDVLCVLNRTWGYDAEGLWVDVGCGAEFVVAR